jgi:outer membrane protein insertion porin family
LPGLRRPPRGRLRESTTTIASLALTLAGGAGSCAHDDAGARPSEVWVHSLTINGNQHLSTDTITEKLATQSTGWWPFAAKKWLDRAALDLDLKRIPALYADNGYFDARVVTHDVRPRGGNAVDVVITVEENAPTRINRVTFEGFPPKLEARARTLARRRDVREGEIVNYDAYAAVKGALQDRLKANGFAYGAAAGDIEVDRDRHIAAVTLRAQPGPEVHMGKTEIVGNGSIPARALLNRVAWKEGDLFDPRDVEVTQMRLYDFGVFSSVRIDLPATPTAVADVHIAVAPGKLHEVRLGAGVGAERLREEVRLRAEWTISNFMGGLRKLRLRLRPAYAIIPSITDVQRQGFAAENDIQLTQPDIFGSRTSAHALVGYDVGISEGYQFHGPRAQLGLERPFFRDRVLGGASWNLQYLNFFNVDPGVFNDASNRFFGFKDPYRLAYFEEFVQLDLRDRPLDARSGGYAAVRSEQGAHLIGSDFHYLKVTPEVRGYLPLGRRAVIAARALAGWLGTYGSDQSPITRRYALGGPSTHRGFSFGRLAPQVLDSRGRHIPVGGNGEVLFSIETRIEVKKVSGNWLGVVPFVDAGDVTPQFRDVDLGNLHLAAGLSLQYDTPIGAIRGGVGVRLNRMGDGNPDPTDRFAYHITIGEAF